MFLDANLRYRLTFEDNSNKTQTVKGADLMMKGITVKLEGTLASELMFIDKE